MNSTARPSAGRQQTPWLVGQLGRQTQVGPDGMVRFNEPLIQAIVARGKEAVPALNNFLAPRVQAPSANLPQLLEGIYTAERLAEAGVTEVGQLYPVLSHLNTFQHPLLQIYLAGYYREINQPQTFGPMLSTLVNQSVNQYPQPWPRLNPTEEVGGTVLELIAKRTAAETVRQLRPYLPQQ